MSNNVLETPQSPTEPLPVTPQSPTEPLPVTPQSPTEPLPITDIDALVAQSINDQELSDLPQTNNSHDIGK